ncbi:lytic murein transglycosylase [Franzmannia qiaohouensis]|uniref:Lytic murein transglycosylase n=1 Tax=Franzmannia qiaohouensis TaxID=1329370 RepID=A0ABU1HAZ0_9GAMM|nr:lytic murein transglycosylase [Halomonas qiaohouensis]MDR5904623.1 lytic murein transglycosylase [Halomonas qiaohouensis]
MRKFFYTSLVFTMLAGCQSGAQLAPPAAADDAETQTSETATDSGTASSSGASSSDNGAERPASFTAWVEAFQRHARSEGISQATLDEAFAEVRYQPRIIELDQSQPEFVRPIWEYLDTAVSSTRINQGRNKLAEHRDTAREMEQRYGVPAEIVVAIWGIESNYGGNFGSFSTIDALATLGYDGRRQSFARGELMAALRIIEQGDIAAEQMVGSWAGAMGHTQFIPSSFEAYAEDGDGDGRRDIWGSIPDVMASTANYLARAGWQRGQPWGVEVGLGSGFDYSQADDTRLSSAQWAERGVRPVNGGSLPTFSEAAVVVPAGASGPAFLVGPNYRAILRYNNATSYALAVGTLADQIAGRSGVVQGWPRSEQPLTRSQVRELQQRLNAAGFDTGTPDGVFGPNTRSGLRSYQRAEGLVPDGFATVSLLERLQRR